MKNIYLEAYIADNLGDDLFLYILAQRYPDAAIHIYSRQTSAASLPPNIRFVMTKRERKLIDLLNFADAVLNKFSVPSHLSRGYMEWRKRKLMKKADAVVYLTGSGFMENKSVLQSDAFYRSGPFVLGCNFGPYFSNVFFRKCRGHFSMASDVCFRDFYSEQLFRDLPNVRREMDIVFGYGGGAGNPLPGDFGPYVLISVMNLGNSAENGRVYSAYLRFIKNCIAVLLNRKKRIVLIGFCRAERDALAVEEILSGFEGNDAIVSFQYPEISIEQAAGLFRYADSVIATRYHSVVLGMLFQKTVYPIAYSEKTVHVLKDIDSGVKYAEINRLESLEADAFLAEYGFRISDRRRKEIRESAERQFSELDKKMM